MISREEAQEIASEWRKRFDDDESFERSWGNYWDTATVPDAGRLQDWLSKDLGRAEARAVGLTKGPLVPKPSTYELGTCDGCNGKGYCRRDVPVGHKDFGKAFPCIYCNGRGT